MEDQQITSLYYNRRTRRTEGKHTCP